MKTKPAPTTLSLIVIRAADVEASLAFYRVLGVAFNQERHGSGPVHYSCDFGGIVLELYPLKANSPQDASPPTTMLGFSVASIAETLAELHTLGVKPNAKPKQSEWGLWLNLTDPDGRTVQINQVTA